MSGGLEVSAYEGEDEGDNWQLECLDKKDEYRTRESPVQLRHEATGMYLSSSTRHVYGNPIPGQQEVAGHRHRQSDQTWSAQEGVYFAEREL